MKVNGNYIERYFFSIFPAIFFVGIVCLFFLSNNILSILIFLLLSSLLFFALDRFQFRKEQLSKVYLIDNDLYINGSIINIDEIMVIRLRKLPPPDSSLIIELYFSNDRCLKFMDKSKSIFYNSKNKFRSKSLDILFEKFPLLRNKLKAQYH